MHASLNPWGNCLAWCPGVKMTSYEHIRLDLSRKRFGLRYHKKTGQFQLQAYAIQENLPFDQQAWEQFWGTISYYKNWINPQD